MTIEFIRNIVSDIEHVCRTEETNPDLSTKRIVSIALRILGALSVAVASCSLLGMIVVAGGCPPLFPALGVLLFLSLGHDLATFGSNMRRELLVQGAYKAPGLVEHAIVAAQDAYQRAISLNDPLELFVDNTLLIGPFYRCFNE